MTRRSSPDAPQELLAKIRELLTDFESKLKDEDLRSKVKSLVPVVHALRDLGSSLVPRELATAARDRILFYLLKYSVEVINGDELLVVGGIGEWARRVRELRVQFGWKIASGTTVKEMLAEGELDPALNGQDVSSMKPDDYILLSPTQDRDAAHRWNVANSIRKERSAVVDKILKYFRANVGQSISGEELRYVAKDKTEWARRVRELRTEQGWPIHSKMSGRPDLEVGEYVLEADRQAFVHDRQIPDAVRREVLRRDLYKCTNCGWSQKEWNSADPRFLELHHKQHHIEKGSNEAENLRTLCNVCHDKEHAT